MRSNGRRKPKHGLDKNDWMSAPEKRAKRRMNSRALIKTHKSENFKEKANNKNMYVRRAKSNISNKKAMTYTRKAVSLGTIFMILMVFVIAGITAYLTDT